MATVKTMRAVAIRNEKGSADALYIDDNTQRPTPARGHVLVKVKAFGLNRMDLLQREGKYPVPPQAPKTMGVEFSGTVEELGEGVPPGLCVGEEVYGLVYGGAYAEYVSASADMLIRKPKDMLWEQAAGVPETWMTATQALHLLGNFQPGETVLFHAGASGVSIAGIQLAQARGAKNVYVTASSAEKIDFCTRELGATAGFNYRTQDWSAELLKATGGRGADVIVDFIGAEYFQGNLNAVALDGRIVCLGLMSGASLPAGVSIEALLRKRVKIIGSTLRSRSEAYQKQLRDQLVKHACPKFADKSFKILIDRVLPWEKITEAHKLMESNRTRGKIICVID